MPTKKPNTKKVNPFDKKFNEDLPMHDFTEDSTFTGMFEKKRTLGEGEKEFDVFIMLDVINGERKFIPTSYTIVKTIEGALEEYKNDVSKVVFNFEFLGKTTVDGKPFNKFNTSFCTLKEYEEFVK
jgi:hypothetical protein